MVSYITRFQLYSVVSCSVPTQIPSLLTKFACTKPLSFIYKDPDSKRCLHTVSYCYTNIRHHISYVSIVYVQKMPQPAFFHLLPEELQISFSFLISLFLIPLITTFANDSEKKYRLLLCLTVCLCIYHSKKFLFSIL